VQKINLLLLRRLGGVHMGAIDDAVGFFKYKLEESGLFDVTYSENTLDQNAVNVVFGSHIMNDFAQLKNFNTVLCNLEQLEAPQCGPRYRHALKSFPAIEYSPENLKVLPDYAPVGFVEFEYAPYLAKNRPIFSYRTKPHVFYGSMNQRRKDHLHKLTNYGIHVDVLPNGLYGEQRDCLLSDSQIVYNFHYYNQCVFEQVRAFYSISMGCLFVSERNKNSVIPPRYENSVYWLREDQDYDILKAAIASNKTQAIRDKLLHEFVTYPTSPKWQTIFDFLIAQGA